MTVHLGQTGRAHVLYRMYDESGSLLYVGITVDAAMRFRAHQQVKPWWRDVRTITLAHFADRADLEVAEREAIRSEQPRYNVHHRAERIRPLTAPSKCAIPAARADNAALIERLDAAVARLRSLESAPTELREVIREIAPRVRQLDIVERTGWTREYIRRIAASEPPAGKQ